MYLNLGRAEPAPSTTTETPGPVSPMPLERVLDTKTKEFGAVCRVYTKMKRGHSVGSGVLITPRHVLTCAHVIFPPEEPYQTQSIQVFVAQNGPADEKNGIKADGWAVRDGWMANCCRTWDEDYGIIKLSKTVPTPFWPMPPRFDPRFLPGKAAYLAGYPARTDDPDAHFMYRSRGTILGTMVVESCAVGQTGGRRGTFVNDTTRLVANQLDSAKSMSGGPLWSFLDNRRILWGLHAEGIGVDGLKKGILLNKSVRAQIAQWVSHGLTAR
jgi:V8-like Glu-specific endopeptidase